MNTTQLKTYAPAARRAFIAAVSAQAARLGITARGNAPAAVQGDVLLIEGQAFPKGVAPARGKLVKRVADHGFGATMEAIAYTWFNRLAAIRYMELLGYLEHGFRALSHPEGRGRPEILDHAADVALPGLDRAKAVALKLDGTKDEELYRLLLMAQCNALHKAMPFLFERIGDETELLLPANLLHTDSLIRQLVEGVDEEAWEQIDIIGWLYQFYISEKKDQVIGKVVASEDIPAATQLFTPNWIVKYMVQNALGAQWLATYPSSPLKGQMDYYIEPAEQTAEVNAQLAAITPSTLDPEALTLIDPACGSGHILVEGYDLFKAIYLERGYRREDVAQLILTQNLFGLDIDERAAQLTGFALTMKGRADDRRLFERGVRLNVMALVDSAGFDAERVAEGVRLEEYGVGVADLAEVKGLFEHATTFGSLIQVPEGLAAKLAGMRRLSEAASEDLFVANALRQLGVLVRQAGMLAGRYDAVVANPPYMGSGWFSTVLKEFVNRAYKAGKTDLYGAFTLRNMQLAKDYGHIGMITIPNWMFISSFESLRNAITEEAPIASLVHNGRGVWGSDFGSCSYVLQRSFPKGISGRFLRLFDKQGSVASNEQLESRFHASPLFTMSNTDFSKIPGSPVAYWISSRMRSLFADYPPISTVCEAQKGLATCDSDRFVRQWWEVDNATIGLRVSNTAQSVASKCRWFPLNKGGNFRHWYGNVMHVVNWEKDGKDVKAHIAASYPYLKGNTSFVTQDTTKYFLQSIVWTYISSADRSFRFSPGGEIASNASQSAYSSESNTYVLLAYFNTPVVAEIMRAMSPTLNSNLGEFLAIPFPRDVERDQVIRTSKELVQIAKDDWNAYERSWDFQSLPLLTAPTALTPTLESTYTTWITQNRTTIAEMKRLEEENNRLFIDAYGLADELTPDVPIDQITLTVNPAYRYGGKLTDEELWTRFRQDTMEEVISYAIGCVMGRYSLDEPGLIYAHSGNDGFDPSRYARFPADPDGILPFTDTDWFDDDAMHRVVEFIAVAWDPAHLEENLTFLADNLSPKKNESSRETLRRYLCDRFFKDHLQTYKNRPIYWLFTSGKQKAFQCLVYLHRYNEGTLARMRSEYVIPLQGKMTARLEKLHGDIEAATSTAHRTRLTQEQAKLQKQQVELLAFDEKLRHYADRRIALDLDDGVKVNYGRFGDLLAEVKAVTGAKPEDL